ncbi:MAG: DUF3313 domain-containing protein [Deltaproteobacteria bacterium]|nr:DUF3313 domain-containing protein [Deltaproteobacteria bacterium]
MKTLKLLAAVTIMLGFLQVNAGPAISEEKYSGFLEDYPTFTADKDRPGALIYHKAGAELKKYTKIMLDPIEIWYAKDSKYKGISPDDLKTLADSFRQVIIAELEPDYPVVSKPGPDVLGLRLAITDVHVARKKRGLLGYTPVGLVVTTGMHLAGMRISLQNASIEGEMLDSQSYERLGALIDRGAASPTEKEKKAASWEEVEKTLKFYAKRLRGRMDAEHGR